MADEQRKIEYDRARKAYRKSNESRWVFALWSSRIVGKYGRGGSSGLADDMGVSADTVEDHAHAFWMFNELRELGRQERIFVQNARKLPYVYYSHFRSLYDLRISRSLSIEQIMSLLIDIVQAEGTISTRNLEDHTNRRFGDTRTWQHYAAKALKELNKTEGQPDLPNTPEGVGNAHSVILTTEDGPAQFIVIAYNKSRAEEIARKQMAKDRGEDVEKEAKCIYNEVIGEALTDSKNILNVTSSWLGDNA